MCIRLIYIVTEGEYEEYYIKGCFSSLEKAKECEGAIETYALDGEEFVVSYQHANIQTQKCGEIIDRPICGKLLTEVLANRSVVTKSGFHLFAYFIGDSPLPEALKDQGQLIVFKD